MQPVHYFDGLVHEGEDSQAAWKKLGRNLHGPNFVWQIVQEKVNFAVNRAYHDGVGLAGEGIATLHPAIVVFDE